MIVDNVLVCDMCDSNHHHIFQDINWYNSKATYTNDICEICIVSRAINHNQRTQEDIMQERQRIISLVRERRMKRDRIAEC